MQEIQVQFPNHAPQNKKGGGGGPHGSLAEFSPACHAGDLGLIPGAYPWKNKQKTTHTNSYFPIPFLMHLLFPMWSFFLYSSMLVFFRVLFFWLPLFLIPLILPGVFQTLIYAITHMLSLGFMSLINFYFQMHVGHVWLDILQAQQVHHSSFYMHLFNSFYIIITHSIRNIMVSLVTFHSCTNQQTLLILPT